jgi:CDP-diacylglycerol---serine O-phosphatidyltransferase
MNEQPSARYFVNFANLVTAASLAGGFVALILADQGEYGWAAGVLVVSGVLDLLDGPLARLFRCSGPFGAQLDSLSDMVTFGAVPAFILYQASLKSVPVAGLAACLVFVLCGAWRLARFPLLPDRNRFVGLPIPPSALIAAGLAAWGPPAAVLLVVTFLLSLLMVSEIPFPSHRGIFRIPPPRRSYDAYDAYDAIDVDEPSLAPASAISSRRRG